MNTLRQSNLIHQYVLRRISSSRMLALLLLALPYSATAQFTCAINNGTVSIIGYGGPGGAVSIPGTIDGLPVTSVGANAFFQCYALTGITIPDSVTNIGWAAFYNCCSPASVTIGHGVISIGDYAFSYCPSLRGIYFCSNAPSLGGSSVFLDSNLIVYCLPGTSGWGPTFGGRPTALWPPPAIQTPPKNQTAEVGSPVEFRVTARGNLVSYQWFFNDTNRLTCSDSVLQLADVQSSQAGAYTVVVTNPAGSVTSAPALLNVIPRVERRMVPGLTLTGQPGSSLNLDFTAALAPSSQWTTLDSAPLTDVPQWYFDVSQPLPEQRFYRAWQTGPAVAPPVLSFHFVPAITLTGVIGSSVRVDYINQFGPVDAWVNLATVTLTNTSQRYFDTSAIGQPQRLWRIMPGP